MEDKTALCRREYEEELVLGGAGKGPDPGMASLPDSEARA